MRGAGCDGSARAAADLRARRGPATVTACRRAQERAQVAGCDRARAAGISGSGAGLGDAVGAGIRRSIGRRPARRRLGRRPARLGASTSAVTRRVASERAALGHARGRDLRSTPGSTRLARPGVGAGGWRLRHRRLGRRRSAVRRRLDRHRRSRHGCRRRTRVTAPRRVPAGIRLASSALDFSGRAAASVSAGRAPRPPCLPKEKTFLMKPNAMRFVSGRAAAAGTAISRSPSWPVIVAVDDLARRACVDRSQREAFGAAEAVALDQHALAACRPARPDGGDAAASPAARSRAARSLTRARSSCGMRAAGVPSRGLEREDVKIGQPAFLDDVERVREHRVGLGREAGDDVGAEDDIGPQRAHLLDRSAIASSRRCRRFMRFRIMSSPACSDRCRCGISRGSSAMRVHQIVVGLDGVDRGQPQPRQVRHLPQDRLAPACRASARPAGRRHSWSCRRRSAPPRDSRCRRAA